MAFLEQLVATFYSFAVLLEQTSTIFQKYASLISGIKRLGSYAYNVRCIRLRILQSSSSFWPIKGRNLFQEGSWIPEEVGIGRRTAPVPNELCE